MLIGLQKELEQYCHKRKENMKEWWLMLARAYLKHKGSITPWKVNVTP